MWTSESAYHIYMRIFSRTIQEELQSLSSQQLCFGWGHTNRSNWCVYSHQKFKKPKASLKKSTGCSFNIWKIYENKAYQQTQKVCKTKRPQYNCTLLPWLGRLVICIGGVRTSSPEQLDNPLNVGVGTSSAMLLQIPLTIGPVRQHLLWFWPK